MSAQVETEAAWADGSSDSDRRRHARHPGRALAEFIRESDPLRHVLRVELLDVSLTGVGLLAGIQVKTDERIRIRLRNVVQRFLKEVRGVVRWTMPTPDGKFRVGVELQQPFSALDMQMLRRAGVGTTSESSRVWV